MKITSTNLLIVLAVQVSQAQSTFLFENYFGSGNLGNAPVFDAAGNRLAGTGYLAELYGGATLDSLQPLLSWEQNLRTIRTFGTGTGAGYVLGYIPGSGGRNMSVNTVGPGDHAYVQMRAWDASLGSTFEAAAAQGLGGYGESVVLYLWGGDPLGVPPGTPAKLQGLQSFSLLAVPEPSATALWLLGIGLAAGLHGKTRKLKT